ncbi:hypothetical protein [Microbacterium capsulatum]|uniref:ABC transporter permease n=1 Tax=Microbacterium capsulatum TaxID=3041921 RepID=A0ABU0XC76_9MICO|nr:hypothetical protein [Microbacterium sp. ASV81]MDQ4212712.1 hypothetical protein [Microbacterium sp. ASV81]
MSATTARSPRTPQEPMAFTRQERNLGGLWTWLIFLILLELVFLIPLTVDLVTHALAFARSDAQ